MGLASGRFSTKPARGHFFHSLPPFLDKFNPVPTA